MFSFDRRRTGRTRVATAGAVAAVASALVIAAVLPMAPAAAQTAPDAPASVTLARGNGFVDVSWPTVTGATGHHVVYSTDSKQSWTRAATNEAGTPSGANTTYRITGTSNVLPYIVAVAAVNTSGTSAWTDSDRIEAVVSPLPVVNVSLQRTTHNGSPALTVAWDQCDVSQLSCNRGLPVTGYFVNLSTDNAYTWGRAKAITTPTSGQDGLTITVDGGTATGADRYSVLLSTGVFANLPYTASVGLENGAGVSWVNSSQVAATSSLADVASLTVVRGNSTLDLEWPAVTGATGYDIAYSNDFRETWHRAASNVQGTVSGSNRTYQITGADNAKTYYLAIRSLNSTGQGRWTDAPAALPASTPSQVQHLSVTRGDGTLSVVWDQCDMDDEACNGGAEITSVAINLSADGSASWMRVKTVTDFASDSDLTVNQDGGIVPGKDRWTVALANNIDNAVPYTVAVGVRNHRGTSWRSFGPLSPYTG